MLFIVRFRGDALVEYWIICLVVRIPITEDIFPIYKKAKNYADGKGITCASGNQNGRYTTGNTEIIERSRL